MLIASQVVRLSPYRLVACERPIGLCPSHSEASCSPQGVL